MKNIKNELENIKKDNNSFAFELLSEIKKSSRRKFIIIVILIITLIFTNVAWLIYENSFETITEQTTVDGSNGTATYLENSSNGGDINYGKDN